MTSHTINREITNASYKNNIYDKYNELQKVVNQLPVDTIKKI